PSGGQAASPAAAPQAPAAPASSPAAAPAAPAPAASPAAAAPAGARSGGVLRFGQSAADLGTLDPHYASGTQDRTLVDMVSTALFYPKVANYSGGFILCKRPAEKLGPDGLKTRTVGTGPFKFQRYSPKERVELVANDAYFRGKPQLDGVDFRFMADLNSREL